MSYVEIVLKHPKLGERKITKDDNALALQDSGGNFLIDDVYEAELTAQAHLNFLLLLFKEKGFVRI